MITTIWSMTLAIATLSSLQSMNPIKVSMSVLISAFTLFFMMSLASGVTWFSIILILLFMGGIIMMFMILSSILPNEKSLKSKGAMMMFMVLIIAGLVSPHTYSMESSSMNSKSFMLSGMNFLVMMVIVLFYFLSSMSVLSSEQTPMRSLDCYQNLIL